MSDSLELIIVAGEVSGDMRAAELVAEIRVRRPDIAFWGIGGSNLRAHGVRTIYDAGQMAVTGLAEVAGRLAFFKKVLDDISARAQATRPAAAILVDYPEFNLALAARLRRYGVKIIYYVCPQVWAWRRARIGKIARRVDRLLAIFPFEAEYFENTGLRVDFVGHPLVDTVAKAMRAPPPDLPWAGEPRIGILPGSRQNEVRRHLPVMLDAACLLESVYQDPSFIVAAASAELASYIEAIRTKAARQPRRCAVVTGQTYGVLRTARAAMVASGTATLEAALMGCPMAIVYRTATLTYALLKQLVAVPRIGMVNIIAGRELCAELIQRRATAGNISAALQPIIDDGPERTSAIEGLRQVAGSLGVGGAAAKAAEIVLAEIVSTANPQ